jgi:hypothetical protein
VIELEASVVGALTAEMARTNPTVAAQGLGDMGREGVYLNPLGFFPRHSIEFVWSMLRASLPSCTPWLKRLSGRLSERLKAEKKLTFLRTEKIEGVWMLSLDEPQVAMARTLVALSGGISADAGLARQLRRKLAQ